MKFLKSNILTFAALAALAFSGCSKEEITYGPESDGLYFSTNSAKAEVTDDQPVFTLNIYRQGLTDVASYSIVVEGNEDGIFNIPSVVNFGEGSDVGTIQVTADLDKMTAGAPYGFSLSFGDGVPECIYGIQAMDVTVKKLKNYTPAEPIGKGTCNWPLRVLFNLDLIGLPIEYRTVVDNPTEAEFLVYYFILRDEDDPLIIEYNTETNEVHIPLDSETGFYYNGNMVLVTDGSTLYKSLGYGPNVYEQYKSYYNPLLGEFNLNIFYYWYQGDGVYGASGKELPSIDGFGDYSISMTYAGVKTAPYGAGAYALVDYTVGDDTDKVVFLASTTLDEESLVNAIMANDPQCTTIVGSTEGTAEVPLDGPGQYTVVGVTFNADGVDMLTDSFTFSTTDGIPENEDLHWPVVGTAIITDGWITAKSAFLGVLDKPTAGAAYWEVDVRESADKPGLYRLKDVWTSPECPLVAAGLNYSSQPVDIYVDASDPDYVVIDIQYSGFTDSEGRKYYITNYAGWALSQGQTKEQIQASNFNTVMKDNLIAVYPSFYGYNETNMRNTQTGNPTSYIEFNFNDAKKARKYARPNDGRFQILLDKVVRLGDR